MRARLRDWSSCFTVVGDCDWQMKYQKIRLVVWQMLVGQPCQGNFIRFEKKIDSIELCK